MSGSRLSLHSFIFPNIGTFSVIFSKHWKKEASRNAVASKGWKKYVFGRF